MKGHIPISAMRLENERQTLTYFVIKVTLMDGCTMVSGKRSSDL